MKNRLLTLILIMCTLNFALAEALPEATPEAVEAAQLEEPAEAGEIDLSVAADGAPEAIAEPPEGAPAELPESELPETELPEEPGEELESELPEEPEAAAALPQVGEVVFGFEVIELRDYPLVDATIVRFEHQKTGAELYYIANDDTNRAFDLTFFTDAVDNTGLPHVFEHATLSGSRRYPSRSLFFSLMYQTYHTYMNALTGQRMTSYPVASLSEAQLLKLADFYADSCLHPMILEDESIFRTEAWRYRLDDPEGPLTIEGTVYSEMLGSMSISRMASYNARRAALPGSMVGNISGGDPDCIPDMTWQMLRDYHDRYYHPSNCAAYLYGQFENYGAFLQLLDGCFSEYERREFVRQDAGYLPIEAPVEQSVAFPVEQGSPTEHTSYIYYTFVCPGLNGDADALTVAGTLASLLSDNASGLMQRLQRELPYGSFRVGLDSEGPETCLIFIAANVNPEDAGTLKAAVDDSLREVASGGFPQAQVDGAMASLNISARLVREGSDPVNGIIVNLAQAYAGTGEPWRYLDDQAGLFCIDDWNRQGLYAELVSKYLVDSQTTALVTTYPQPGAKEAKAEALAERLAGVKAAMTEEELSAIAAASAAGAPAEDVSEYVTQLSAVSVESLPEELKRYDVTDAVDAGGIRHIDAVAGVEGIGQANVFLDLQGLPQEDIHWFQLYTDLLGELDTAEHTRAELATRVSRYLYSGSIHLSLPRIGRDDYHPYLRMQWIALDDDLDEGYDLMRELIFDTRVDDPEKLLEQVEGLKASLRAGITANPGAVLLRRALGRTRELYRYNSYATDLAYYDFLSEAGALLESDPEAAVARLRGIQAYLNNRENAVTLFAGSAASIALNRELADRFLAGLGRRENVPVAYDFPVAEKNEALVIDSGVQYNLLAADLETLGLEDYDGGLSALSTLVTDSFLKPILRDQRGVYAPGAEANDACVDLYAYRDPNIAGTFEMFDALPDMVAELSVDQATLDGCIMSAYSGYAMPEGELSGAVSAALNRLMERPEDQKLTWMRQLKRVTPADAADFAGLLRRLSAEGSRMTAGGSAAIGQSAGLYDAILNPFGAADLTQIQLSDVGEDHPLYEAVRFAFENGLMDAKDGDTFGVDDTATRGELLAAFNVLIGGRRDEQAALSAFAELGLADGATPLTEPATMREFLGLLINLGGQLPDDLPQPADIDAMTRGELAGELWLVERGDARED